MPDHTPTPWSYRPLKHDDWGWIRDADGSLAATARDGRVMSERFDEFRAAKKDPYAANAAFIVNAVNNHDALVKALETARARIEYLGAACNDPRHFQNNADVVLPAIDRVLGRVKGAP
jgi:hypothetical protein